MRAPPSSRIAPRLFPSAKTACSVARSLEASGRAVEGETPDAPVSCAIMRNTHRGPELPRPAGVMCRGGRMSDKEQKKDAVLKLLAEAQAQAERLEAQGEDTIRAARLSRDIARPSH